MNTTKQNNSLDTSTIEVSKQWKRSFKPAVDDDGFSEGIFNGYSIQFRKDGEGFFLLLKFLVFDINEQPINFSEAMGFNLNPDEENLNKITKVLMTTGFEFVKPEYVKGAKRKRLNVVKKSSEDEGEKICEHLKSLTGLVYSLKLFKDEKQFYRIDFDTLKPVLNEEGVQEREFEAGMTYEAPTYNDDENEESTTDLF